MDRSYTTLNIIVYTSILNIIVSRDLEMWVRGQSRSLKMARFDRPHDFLLVHHCNYSSILYHLPVI